MYIKGIYKKKIFMGETGYIVGLIKIKENDINLSLNERTVTFTGYFSNINIDDNLLLNGEFVVHNRYGEQFNTMSYEVLMPNDENSIVNFLSSDLFKGIGENKAQKIYDEFQNKTVDTILKEPEKLSKIKGLTKKNIDILHNKLLEYEEGIDVILKLNEYGFNTKDSNSLYHKYNNKILEILETDIYSVINENFSFHKIDSLALKNKYSFDDVRRLKAGIIYVIEEIINSVGDTYVYYHEIRNCLNRALFINILEEDLNKILDDLIKEDKIVYVLEKYYLKRMYEAEQNIAKRLVYLNNKKDMTNKGLKNKLLELEKINGLTYNDLQKEAIVSSFSKNFLIITGGPGTGKTTIIKSIVMLYEDLFKKNKDDVIKDIALLAPTGRASKRLMEAANVPSQTIHRFLKWNKETDKFGVNEYNKSLEKLVIIDEASMIDTYLLDSLLKGLKYDTKIILVGDYDQLPSVGSGQILKDLILSNNFMVIKLERLYRQTQNSNIITLAYDINKGYLDTTIFNQENDLTYIASDSYNTTQKFSEICLAYKDYSYSDIQILAPMYKTINGIDNLNMLAQSIFNQKESGKKEIIVNDTKYRLGDKVIELVNMPEFNVYNGDIGVIENIDTVKKEIFINYDNNVVKYTKSLFNNFRLGYVTSIHKAQGSEFSVVIIVLLNEYQRMLYRKLLYTGVTRAKNNLYLIGELSAIKKAVVNDIVLERKTTLMEMINKMYEKEV